MCIPSTRFVFRKAKSEVSHRIYALLVVGKIDESFILSYIIPWRLVSPLSTG